MIKLGHVLLALLVWAVFIGLFYVFIIGPFTRSV